MPEAISKMLEMIGRYPRVLNRDFSLLGHKPGCRLGWSSEYVNKSMHACNSVFVDQPKRNGDAAKSGEFSLVGYNPIGVRRLYVQ